MNAAFNGSLAIGTSMIGIACIRQGWLTAASFWCALALLCFIDFARRPEV